MKYNRFILVDYENVQDLNTDIMDKDVKMNIILGENQNKIPIGLIQKIQPFGNSIEWLQVKTGGGKNALDFFIVYFISNYISNNKNREYIIYSKDTGYDPLIEYLRTNNINVRRIVSFKQINVYSKNQAYEDESIKKVKENLKKLKSNQRPKNKKGLMGYIKSLLKKSDEEIKKIIEEMLIQKIIFEENNQIKFTS